MSEACKTNLLGVRVPVVIAEIERELPLETKVEFQVAPLKIYDVKKRADIKCVCCDGIVLLEGVLNQDFFYVGFIDWQVHYQPHETKIEGLFPHPLVKKDMIAFGAVDFSRDCALETIKDNAFLQQNILLRIKITICRYETVQSSALVHGANEFPEYYARRHGIKREQFIGKDSTLVYPDDNEQVLSDQKDGKDDEPDNACRHRE